MSRRNTLATIWLAVVIILAVCAMAYFFGEAGRCEDAGGVLVRTWTNTYECIRR